MFNISNQVRINSLQSSTLNYDLIGTQELNKNTGDEPLVSGTPRENASAPGSDANDSSSGKLASEKVVNGQLHNTGWCLFYLPANLNFASRSSRYIFFKKDKGSNKNCECLFIKNVG